MNIDIHTIWNIFKNEKIEKEYIFYIDKNELKALKISKNETENYGSLDLEYLYHVSDDLKDKEIIVVHNHINDDPKPSFQDFFQFKYLYSLFNLIGVQLNDFLIVSPYGYFSFQENNLFEKKTPSKMNSEPYLKLENIFFENHQIIQKNKKEIIEQLKNNNELIFSEKLHFASSSGFSGKEIFAISRILENETIFFYRYQGDGEELIRILDIIEVLKPIECYILKDDNLYPLKKIGSLSLS